ncbi:PEPxxWA-CTERM sorting domain-containing protein [Sphingomonas sp. ID1715]|uniref:PEPxxWA-CTERM sorting domain-containing protein n=1 Tax=Sphingomonas sp. ID1715 TaxID=1656898 RepID=UPI0020C2FB93|nr:PEPxxWA-CTERM sorting domain-containing protein [Sphingomonas sp. ID1715]
MRKMILALALLGTSVSAGAVTYVGEISGTVTSSYLTAFTDPNVPADIKIGDTITARFSFAKSDESGGPAAFAAGSLLATMMTDQISFDLAGHRWTSRGDFLDGLVPLAFGSPEDPLKDFALTTDDAPGAGDLRVKGYDFQIGEFGYSLYQGMGYAGSFDLKSLKMWANGRPLFRESASAAVAPVPEPATWALMIGGFGVAGAALRRSRRVANPIFAAA